MPTINDLQKRYYKRIAPLDLELLFSFVLKKPREFILAHPEHIIPETLNSKIAALIKRRMKGEPIAYILGEKEFYGLDFKVDQNTLIPRPETELIVELALERVRKLVRKRLRTINIVDIGTGSGNIIISLAYNMEHGTYNNLKLYGLDISSKALAIAEENAKKYKLGKKIKFFHGDLLNPIPKSYKLKAKSWIILANLPYLSSQIYASAPKDVRDYEPKSALFSPQKGLKHYKDLLKQIKGFVMDNVPRITLFLEISPEQKPLVHEMAKQILPSAKVTFFKDLARRWRVCKVEIQS